MHAERQGGLIHENPLSQHAVAIWKVMMRSPNSIMAATMNARNSANHVTSEGERVIGTVRESRA
jgi:hypothetical protein